MSAATSNPADAYEKLYGRALTAEEKAHIRFNLVRYVELLIVLDQQHKEWLEKQKPISD